MRLNHSTPAVLALSALIQLGSALPFFHRRAPSLQSLARRATYSVVPVDGGPIPTNAPEETVVQTVVQTEPPKTTTIFQTDNVTLPPVTNYILTTKTLEGPKEIHTVVITITPTPKITYTTAYSIIDVDSPANTTQVGHDESISTVISFESLYTSTSPLTTSHTRNSSSPTRTHSSKSATRKTPSPATFSATVTTSISSSSSSSSVSTNSTSMSTTKTYDDGHWKTYYPPWNDTRTVGAYIRAVRPTSSLTSLPTLAPGARRSPQEAGTDPAAAEQSIEKKDVKVEYSILPRLLAISRAWLSRF